jgi:hypothetical protein
MTNENIKSEYKKILALNYNDNKRLINSLSESISMMMMASTKRTYRVNQRIDLYKQVIEHAEKHK